MAGNKYGNREQYLKIVKARANLRKLEKKGVVRQGASQDRFYINRYGEAAPETRRLRAALANFHETATGRAQVVKLTREQARELRKSYEHLKKEHRPTILNNRVQIGKDQKVNTRKNKAEGKTTVTIEKKGIREVGKLVYMGPGWEDRVRAFAKRHPDDMFAFEIGDNVNGQTSYQLYDTDEDGTEMLIRYIGEYDSRIHFKSTDSIRLLLDKQTDTRRAKYNAYLGEKNKAYRKKARKSRASKMTDKQKKVASENRKRQRQIANIRKRTK